ncbi:MAG: serine/threonine protein kinase [Planctomycetaceae bacterium]|nr:serine/threonine protein kinase [Planctomycetaceae bacterium]
MSQTGLMRTGDVPTVCVAHGAGSCRRVRQWELLELVGSGSLAEVFRARPAGASSAHYAVKMLRPCWQDDPHAIGLLQREALVGQCVSHPHLIPILASHATESPRFLVMPWLDGESLGARLAAGRRFGLSESLWIARQAAEALGALHGAGWMHGDVTPGNIQISPTGHATLLDLNFARRGDEFGSAADRPILGTCGYLAPEFFTSALRPDPRSDLYSLGAVLFEMLSGRRIHAAETLSQWVVEHRRGEQPDFAKLAPEVPRDVARLVRQMTANDPLRRPQTARELVERLVSLEIAHFSQRG